MSGIVDTHLIDFLDDCFTIQKCYADDVGSINKLKKLFDPLKKHGTVFGYHFTKRHTITKKIFLVRRRRFFVYDEVEIVDVRRTIGRSLKQQNLLLNKRPLMSMFHLKMFINR